MFPPVSIHISIPVARTNTYAFCVINALKFIASNIFPPVIAVKKIYNRTRAISIAFFFNILERFLFAMTPPPLILLLA